MEDSGREGKFKSWSLWGGMLWLLKLPSGSAACISQEVTVYLVFKLWLLKQAVASSYLLQLVCFLVVPCWFGFCSSF